MPDDRRRYTADEINAYELRALDGDAGHQVLVAGDVLGTIRPAGRGWSAHTRTGRTVAHRGRGSAARTRELAVLDLLAHLGITPA